ncbi:heterokaryon incompatibility protein-domain-containing protein [Pisolithus tinctorius]|nr:heterokaryon incompatibility protein-domain-containing protein [Pisolithus tinctorius]
MRLLDVDAVLDREKDIQRADPNVEVLKEADSKSTSYAILSHRWGTEVSYEEMIGLMEMDDGKREKVRNRDGYKKIIKSCEKAMSDGHKFLWVDTCCINKQSSAELSEAINSMYQWYRDAQVCYAYLHDIDEPAFPTEPDYGKFNSSNGWPEWFLRGWTLQELIAPKEVQFFNKGWMSIGDKRNLAQKLERITQIPDRVLRGGLVSASSSVAQIMSWAADRKTTRVEDRAYSLLGLFGVSMPMLYGEGERAFRRLQLEIIRESNDCSIFAWDPYARVPRYGSVLADDPSYFRACRYIQKDPDTSFVDKLIMYIDKHKLGRLKNEAESRKDAKKLSVFLATNAGIQICLPVIPYSEPNPGPYEFRYLDSPRPTTLKAILACSDQHGDLITIDLTSRGSSFDRTLSDNELKQTSPEFMELYLTHHQVDEPACGLTLVDANASHYGFIRCGTFPREMTSNAFTLSSRASDLILIIYANYSAKSRFAVGLGKHFGREWMHVTCDECVANQQDDCKPWSSFAEKAYDMMWSARARLAQKYHSDKLHAHLSQSIWAATVVWETDLVTVDIKKCAGCCVGPHEWTINHAFHSKLDGTSRQVWQDESASMERRKQFEDIRKRFYTLVNMVPISYHLYSSS